VISDSGGAEIHIPDAVTVLGRLVVSILLTNQDSTQLL
jgi:hypothetical protein